MTDEKVPRWVQDRMEAQEAMGELQTGASVGDFVGVTLALLFRWSLFVVFCVIVYLIGKALVG